jgi:hypothetical protein
MCSIDPCKISLFQKMQVCFDVPFVGGGRGVVGGGKQFSNF